MIPSKGRESMGEPHHRQASMTSTVFDTVSRVLTRFTTEPIHSNASTIDLGLDSIHLSELEFELQRVYPTAQLQYGFTIRLSTIDEIVKHVEDRMDTARVEEKTMDLARIPLSPVQRRILFLSRLHPENSHQFEERISFSAQNIDGGRMEKTLRIIVMRHSILRTCYEAERQFALSATECHFSIHDSNEEYEDGCINIEKEPVIRASIRKTDYEYLVNISLHHIAVDGRSIGVFLQELKMIYSSPPQSSLSRPRQYIDDALHKDEHSSQVQLDYWKQKLNGLDSQLLHTDYRRLPTPSVEGSSVEITIPPSLMSSLHFLRRQTGSTSFGVLLSLYRLFVYKTSGYADFPLGVMVENRSEKNKDTIGCFVNSCALRSPLNSSSTFTQFTREIQQSLHEIRDNSSLPFDDVVAIVKEDSDGGTSPLFQILFVMDNVVVPSNDEGFRMNKVPSKTAKYEQSWYITNYGTEMGIKVEYRTDLFRESSIRRSIHFLLFLLQRLAEEPQLRINEISLMRPIDYAEYHEQNTRNKRDYPDFHRIMQSISAKRNIRFQEAIIPTRNIKKMSQRVARVLKDEYISHYGESHRPDDFLVIFVERSAYLIPFVWGGLEAGFCLAPISLDWSIDRRREVLTTIGNALYVTDSDPIPGKYCLQFSSIMNRVRSIGSIRRSLPSFLPSDLLYATFTSGTTGVAKCVCNSGEGMGNLMLNYSREYSVGAHSSIYQVINYAFDIFFGDLFLSLVNDAELTLASGAIPERKEMERAGTTHCFVMPAFLNFSEDIDLWAGLDTVLVTGETMQSRAFRNLLKSGVPLHQLYGATEQTINNTSQRLHCDSPRRAVGKPYRNLSVRAVDKDGKPLPHSWPALLRYSAPGLARGVFAQMERSQKMFPVDDCVLREEEILNDDKRCFDSGDLLRRSEDGNLVFVGRNDHLTKVRGKAVDLREVERHLSSISQVFGCLVRLSSDSQKLITYVVSELPSTEIKKKLGESLPSHMVPDHIISLHRFPTNANGKVDVKALPAPLVADTESVACVIEPRNALEKQLSGIFESLLKKKISITDDFFSFGGNSLLAMLAVQKIESELSLTLPLKRFFQLRRIARIAESLQGPVPSESPSSSEQELVVRPAKLIGCSVNSSLKSQFVTTHSFRIPLSPQQRHLWFQCSFNPESSAGDITMRLKIPDALLLPRLRSILNTLIMGNDGLRTTMLIEGSLPVQYALSATECYYCIREEEDIGMEKLSINNRISISLSRDGQELLIHLHHILVDGRSLGVLHEQLVLLMEGKKLMSARSYLRHCSSTSSSSQAIGEWKKYLTDCPELTLPVEKTGNTGHATVVHKISFDKDLLADFVEKKSCTPFHLLLSSFISTLHRLSNQTDFTIGVVHAGRTAETHDVVGLFVNTLPVRVKDVNNRMNIEAVNDIIDFPFSHCTTPFGEIVQTTNPKRIPGRHPLFQHVINFQNVSGEGDGSVDYEHVTETAFDTCWKVEETEGGFVVRIDYNRAMFGEEFVRSAVGMFEKSMKSLVGIKESVEERSAPEFDVKDIVRRSWKKNLGLESLNDDDNFFDVGGHSLIALAVINELSGVIGKEIPLRLIFEHQTLGEFVHCIKEMMGGKKISTTKKEVESIDPTRIRVSPLQGPILEHMKNNRSESFVRAYNITARIRIKRAAARDDLNLRFNRLCLRHPSLRTFFVYDGSFYQGVVSATECYLPIESPLDEDEAFDVFDSPPIAVSLHDDELRICISHLNVDGHSMKTLVKELADDEEQLTAIGEFHHLNRELNMRPTAEGTTFWKKQLDGFVFNPLRGKPRSSKTRLDAGCVTKEYPDLGGIINKICSTLHCTPFSVLLSSLGATLQHHSLNRESPICIGWPVDLRSPQTEKAIGFASNTLVTTVDASGCSPSELISAVSRQVIGALEHRSTPLDDLLKISGSPSLFDAMIVMDPFSVEEGEDFEVIDEKLPFTKFPLTLFVQYSMRGVKITAHFMTVLFPPTAIESSIEDCVEILKRWASGETLKLKTRNDEEEETIVERQRQFVRVEDLASLCSSIGKCRASLENEMIVLEYDSSISESVLIDHIKHNIPLCLHPDELRSCSFTAEIPRSLPLTPQQLQMYFLSREDSGHYNVPFVQRFEKSTINVKNLTLALHCVRQSNEALRSRLVEEDGEPVQVVVSATESYYHIDAIAATEEEAKTRLQSVEELALELVHSTARLTHFDTGTEIVLLLVISHVICDGWSTSLMQTTLSSVYEQLQSGQKPETIRRTCEEYASMLQSSSNSPKIEDAYLNNIAASLPAEKCAMENDGGVELSRTFHLDKSSSVAMNKRAAALDSTPFSVLLQSISQSIHSVFGLERLNIGTPVTNRSSSTIDVIGCFMNTIVIPVHSSDSSAAKSIQSSLSLNITNFELLKAVRSHLNQSDIRLFDVFVNCRYGMESESNVRVEGRKKSEIHKMSPIYPLEFYVEEEDGEYEIEVKMKRGTEKTIEQVVEALSNILSSREDEVKDEHHKVQKETSWTSTRIHDDIPSLDLSSILYHNSLLNGDGVAIRTPIRELSYSALWRMLSSRASSIRDNFFTTTGEILRADDVIGVRMDHGDEAMLTCLSILIAGAAYLPLLQSWPEERVRHAVEETGCGLVIEQAIDRNKSRQVRWMRRNLIEDTAYVIYTSGTTGKPKGVVAVHRGVVNMLSFTIRNLSMRKDDVIFQFTKFVFDNSVLEIWLALASGATLFIDDSPFTHHRFISSIHQYGITHALLFPGLVAAFSDDQLSALSSLRAWCMGAEKASQPLVDKAIEKGITIVQVYGPTETTTYALSRFMKRGDHANNLGMGLSNTMLRVKFDEGKMGQLFITGEGLMRGYVARTKEQSFADGFYATGDVVTVQNDGTVIFVGRKDGQVKVRGYRIELNEVENALLRFAEQVKVLLFEDQQQLIAFVKSSLTGSELRSRCAKILPDYMIPSRFISLTRFPLTDNAKVDTTNLRNMVNTRLSGDEKDEGKKSRVERRFLEVLKRVGFRFVSLEDNFVEIGGQSIIAIRVMAEIEREFGVTLPTHELYRSKTLRDMIPLLMKENARRVEKDHSQVERIVRVATTENRVRSAVEKIRMIWKSMLSTETFTDDDNFFLIGGDSFKLLKLHNKLVNEFSLGLSLADLLRNLTIKQASGTSQTELLTTRKSDRSSLLRISNPKQAKGTLVLLHPLIGGVQMPYRNLIAQLTDDYEIIGFEHPQTFTLDFAAPQFNSIANLVKSYLQIHQSELTKPANKLIFIGASLGSLLAFEMASQLGIETELIVIDGTSNQTPTASISLEEHRTMMIDILDRYKVEDSVLSDHMISHSWQLYLLSRDYRPMRNESISVHVFSCCETNLNWSEIALLKSVHRLNGDHSMILNPSNSSLITQFIRSLH